ncbi:peptidase family M48-domain-containing protein [Mycena epipterygia]|nr:peptidase family M48-domain-containing protein [Mycena epipterygia]
MLCICSLEVAPETGRRRFMAVSEEEETLVGKIALEQTLQDFRGRILPFDHPITLQVRRITRRILTASNLGHLEGDRPQRQQRGWSTPAGLSAEIPQSPTMNVSKEWVVLVINDRRFINAFAAPGLVCVSTGIMSLARNEEGLAAIIGHEIGHVAMRHMAEHLSENQMFLPIATLLLFLGIGPGLLAPLTKYLYSFPHSRALETEADIVGLKLMSRACYDPGAAPRMFETLRKFEGEHIPKFLNTHPPTLERIAHLKSLLPESRAIYNSNPECAKLEEMRARGYISTIRMDINTGAIF